MGPKGETAPGPCVYLSTGNPVTSLYFHTFDAKDYLICGLSDGTLSVYDCLLWKLAFNVQAFETGVLWIGGTSTSTSDLLFVQARFQGLQVFQLITDQQGKLDLIQVADFFISHEGFCKGFVLTESPETYLFTPSEGTKLGIHTFKQKFIRPMHSLNPESIFKDQKYGTIMTCKLFSKERVLTGYENSEIILWNWKKNEVVMTFPVPECGTLMSLTTSTSEPLHNIVVAAGSENKIVVLKVTENDFEVLKVEEITNPGISSSIMRSDKPILTTAGWDNRIRLFAFKIDPEEIKPFKVKPLAVLDFHSEAVECLAISFLSSGLCRNKWCTAAGSKDGKISIWTLYS